jgi:hypothetical protein
MQPEIFLGFNHKPFLSRAFAKTQQDQMIRKIVLYFKITQDQTKSSKIIQDLSRGVNEILEKKIIVD